MALRLKYAAIIVGLGWAGLTTAYLPPQCEGRRTLLSCAENRNPYGPPTPEASRLAMLDRMLTRERDVQAIIAGRDQLRTVLAQSRAAQPTVWIDPRFDAASAARLSRVASDAWARTQPTLRDVPIAIGFPTTRRNAEFGPSNRYTRYVLPQRAGEPCLVLLPIVDAEGHARFYDTRTQGVLGACAFYAAFGMPGSGTGSWILNGGALLATAGIAQPRHAVAQSLFTPRLFGYDILSLSGFACQQGNVDQCLNVVRRPVGLAGWSDIPGLAAERRVPGTVRGVNPELSWYGGSYLGDLLRSQGRDKFAHFWHSAVPVDSAFAEAFGTPLGVWTRDWAQTHQDFRIQPLRASSVLLTLLCVVVFVTGGAAYSVRRQVA